MHAQKAFFIQSHFVVGKNHTSNNDITRLNNIRLFCLTSLHYGRCNLWGIWLITGRPSLRSWPTSLYLADIWCKIDTLPQNSLWNAVAMSTLVKHSGSISYSPLPYIKPVIKLSKQNT
jgi:hypothetical protein